MEVEIGLRPDSRELYAQFLSLDPESELPPSPNVGFLPPEDGTGRGMGYFTYTIKQRPGLVHGKETRNIAVIIFDRGEVIATNQVDPHDTSKGTDPTKEALVTLDLESPASRISSLPALTNSTIFAVDWTGQDGVIGSGVGLYDIFVSVDGNPFTVWLKDTRLTTAQFTGELGRSYGFYSIATDKVGNAEATPGVPDAFTTVVADGATIRGIKFEDLNGNRQKDPTELGLKGWTIFIDLNSNGLFDIGEQSTVTATDGTYEFIGLRSGVYSVGEVMQDGWQQTFPGLSPANAGGSSASKTRSVLHQNPLIAFGEDDSTGHRDVDADGLITPIDVLMIINFLNENPSDGSVAGLPTKSPFYDVNGDDFISPLDVLLVINELNSRNGSGAVESKNSAASPNFLSQSSVLATGTHTVTLTAGANASGVDFGNFRLGSVAGNVTTDANRDGTYDDPSGGYTAFLDSNGNGSPDANERTTLTDGAGLYRFDRLPFGNYLVRMLIPVGFEQVTPAGGHQAAITSSGVALVGRNFEVRIKNRAPTGIVFNGSTVPENSVSGTVIGTVSATDPDRVDTHTFTLVNNASGRVNLVGNQLRVAGPINFELSPTFTVRVRATDAGNLSVEQDLTITVKDVNEPPIVNSATFTLPENSANATVVGTLSASDPDAGSVLTWLIIGGNTGGAFAIHPTTARITVANRASLDFETTPTFSLVVRATDNGLPVLSGTKTIVVNLTDVPEYDFGDAPNSYGTTLAANGARHLATGPMLGATRDVENDGQFDAAALGDDAAGDDEDGVTLPPLIIPGLEAQLRVNVSAAAKLDAWIDFNRNGVFDNTEQVFTSRPMVPGTSSLTVDVPAGATEGRTYARFRLSTAGGLTPKGAAADGEIEDYSLQILNPALGVASVIDDPGILGGKALLLTGTNNNDDISVEPGKSSQVTAEINKSSKSFPASSFGRIIAIGRAGNDSIEIDKRLSLPTLLYGDAGNDTISGGAGPDVIYGGDGRINWTATQMMTYLLEAQGLID